MNVKALNLALVKDRLHMQVLNRTRLIKCMKGVPVLPKQHRDTEQQHAYQSTCTDAGKCHIFIKPVEDGQDSGRKGRGHGRFHQSHLIRKTLLSIKMVEQKKEKRENAHPHDQASNNRLGVPHGNRSDSETDYKNGERKGCPA